ncbi:MAG TPA: DUF2461 domain-containing protein [Vicinamibacterales bacterium]|nr:DUF2461 domain-containing protein [Vicinamibacterales bacterium]
MPNARSPAPKAPEASSFSGFPREGIDFFNDLQTHNNRDWFQAHKDVYDRACREPMRALAAQFELQYGPAHISRINRDMRFSRDGAPYKTFIAAHIGWSYVQLSAHGLYVGTGMYKPEPAVLRQFRDAVASDSSGRALARMIAALRKKGYQVGTHESVGSAPRGYPADHPRIDLLRMKDIHAGKLFADEPWLATPKALPHIKKTMTEIKPLAEWLRRYVKE